MGIAASTSTAGSPVQPQTSPAPQRALDVSAGRPHPLGAVPDSEGVNFSVFSENATSVELLLFDAHDDLQPVQQIRFDDDTNRTFHFWHMYVKGLRPGAHYAYRVAGPDDLHGRGFRFNPNKVLIDPYARGNTHTLWDRGAACSPEDNVATSMRSVVVDLADYDWEGDRPLNRPINDSVIYEMHVRGFTQSPTSRTRHPGTFAGVIEKIPYLKSLGVTAVELLPVCDFDETEIDKPGPLGRPLRNYWGYSTVSFFTPHHGYCVAPEEGAHIREFKDMVKALHRAGIEVILDMVFNHTSEGNHQGPTINFRGFENSIYYHLVPGDRQYYMDYSGCGNTVNCNHPVVDKLILECLSFWVQEMHVDGFRFDEGSILSRGPDGAPMAYPPAIWHIELAEALADSKVIAEAWDAAGLYQIGYFPGYRWAEWNGRFRDDVRKFVRGDPGVVGAVASRVAGSSDLYQSRGHLPVNSVNFITCHDGFTLNDLVSYNNKHNDANGEGNRDGIDDNTSWNCGFEGVTEDENVQRLRERQIRNFGTILLLSQGVPMITAGDELRRTQLGNNNAYCQDSEISWFDWDTAGRNEAMFRFFKQLIAFRKRHSVLRRPRFFTGQVNERGLRDVAWHGCNLFQPGFNDPGSHVLAFTLGSFDGEADLHVMMNMDAQPLEFEVPEITGRSWNRAIDTSAASPYDIAEPGGEKPYPGGRCTVDHRSIVVLVSS